ncbi:lipocalin-like domain-containing protein [Pseudomonas sp. UBA4194]|uniref:lipocalin-like domain-containing protein n=1 Tax=Pseudomonas sp. UBA4194 TaxID=1947317 RepID=UPI0025FEBB0A|nr:lipocalin-like domain-containing protein [Pseudomonas sp. UBA4194]
MNARALLLLLVLTVLAGCDAEPPPSGFAGLGGQAGAFADVRPGRPFVFPQDHGAHPDFRIEWWYLTANLEDDQGQAFGVQWTLFRSALAPGSTEAGWSNRNLWIGHAGLTTATRQYSAQRLARGGIGQAGVQAQPFQAWIDDWHLRSQPQAAEALAVMDVQARGAGFEYRLELRSSRPLVLQGEQGYSRKSEAGQASYYYSQPFFTAAGELRIDGKTYRVKGRAWLDREWSSQPLAADQSGWDWFSLHLDDGQQLMLFRLRGKADQHFLSGNWIDAQGRSVPLAPGSISLRTLAHTDVAGRAVPTRWAIDIPSRGLHVQTTALNPKAWMEVGTPYWEGPVSLSGSQQGEGYLEMTGY